MTDDIYAGLECGMCGEALVGDGDWCGNDDCVLGNGGPGSDEPDDKTISGEVEEVDPNDAPDGMPAHDSVEQTDITEVTPSQPSEDDVDLETAAEDE